VVVFGYPAHPVFAETVEMFRQAEIEVAGITERSLRGLNPAEGS